MSFTRVNPPGWSGGPGTSGDEFTSTQANQLDIDHANALDKVNGDTLTGGIQIGPTGQILASTTSNIYVNGAGGITVGPGGGASIEVLSGGGIQVASGATINVQGATGVNVTGVDGIVSNVSTGIIANTPSGISSNAVGGFQLGGGASDWPTFSATRSRTIWMPGDGITGANLTGTATTSLAPGMLYSSGDTYFQYGTAVTINVSSGSGACAYYMPLRAGLHNGATLSSAAFWFGGSAAHTGLPAHMPQYGIFAYNPQTLTLNSLKSTANGFVTDASATLLAYVTNHSTVLTMNQANVIDTTQFSYFAIILDEYGSGAQAGNLICGVALSFTAIPNMAFA